MRLLAYHDSPFSRFPLHPRHKFLTAPPETEDDLHRVYGQLHELVTRNVPALSFLASVSVGNEHEVPLAITLFSADLTLTQSVHMVQVRGGEPYDAQWFAFLDENYARKFWLYQVTEYLLDHPPAPR